MTLHDLTDGYESELEDSLEILQLGHFTQEILH